MPKTIAKTTDSRLIVKSRQHLVKLADEHGINLCQNYNRERPPPVGRSSGNQFTCQ
jgi:IS5 family transposase